MAITESDKDQVVKAALWRATVYAAFQRVSIYLRDNADEKMRSDLKGLFYDEINKKLPTYSNVVSEEDRLRNIADIASAINARYSGNLINGTIPIGVVQKGFNLYLKLLWCLGEIGEPQHCPVDSIIIGRLPYRNRVAWTQFRDIEDYKAIIKMLKVKAAGKSLAQWELEEYNIVA